MKKPELLAPAGNIESFYAAVNAGCDAVYLGGYTFGARNYAGNFSNEELTEVIKYAHIYGVKVYVTVNTLVYENEVEMFLNYIDFLHKINVDAVLIQDIGMLDLVRKTYPNLELHASTQMHIHNIEGVKLCEELGLKRVVLARETPIEVIKEIKNNTNIQIETFIHGALCVSYSGQCLMSSLIGGRSGNRGTCAQCCRKPYDLLDEKFKTVNVDNYLLSMKDLNTINNIDKLIDIGIDSLKIEGRMKRPEYVYLVVSTYRKAIDNYLKYGKTNITDEDIKELKKLFNRDFTKGYILNELNDTITNSFRPNHMGIEIGTVIEYKNNKAKIKLIENISQNDGIRIIGTKDYGQNLNKIYLNNRLVNSANKEDIIEIDVQEEVSINSKVLKTTDYKQLKDIELKLKSPRKVPIKGFLKIKTNTPLSLELDDGKNKIIYQSDYIADTAKTLATSKERVLEQINKLGNTPFIFEKVDCEIDDNLFINIKELNNLRREAVELLTQKRIYEIEYKKEKYDIELNDYKKENNINIYVKTKDLYNNINKDNYNFIYVDQKYDDNPKQILKIDRVINDYQEYNELLLVGELGSIHKYKNVETDFSLNVTNSYAVAFLHSLNVSKITLSHELNENQIESIVDNYKKRYNKNPNLEIIVYGKIEAMITKYNLLKKYHLKEGYLKDDFKNLYTLRSNENFMTIYDYKITKVNDPRKYFNKGINNMRYNLIDSEDLSKLED